MTTSGRDFLPLGTVAAGELRPAREMLHQAAQIVQALPRSLLPPRADDSHAALRWDEGRRALSSETVNGARLALRPADLTLAYGPDDRPANELPLAGRTLDEALAWLRDRLGDGASALTLATPYEIHPHPVQDGAPFALEHAAAFEELARWYGNAAALLDALAATNAEAGSVRCWPHHFDIATLLVLAGDGGEDSVTIGAGLSPGDATFTQPYVYVTPWPAPSGDTEPPTLSGGGRWYTGDFTGAVLLGEDLVPATDQHAAATAFLDSAVNAGRTLLASSHP